MKRKLIKTVVVREYREGEDYHKTVYDIKVKYRTSNFEGSWEAQAQDEASALEYVRSAIDYGNKIELRPTNTVLNFDK